MENAMSRIQVTPERLFEASREVERTRAQMGDTREELVRLIRWMESMWSGMVRERFLERFEETQPRMIETLEHLTHIAKELRDIGVRFQQADEMSGAAVAGTVATMSIGLKAANSPSDKGYRMVYNSQWHMWLPVNEKGVTDQAALQAFEKDKGKLDISTLNQGTGPVEPIDQDLIQLQIEAFELGVNPFTGEPVTESYAKLMIASLKWSQIVAGIGLVTGGLSGGKGPYKGRGTNPAIAKVKQTIKDAKAKREKSSNDANGTSKGLKIPQGLTQKQFEKVSAMIRKKVGHLSDDIVVQGSRAKGTAKATSDIDFAIRVSPEKFNELIKDSFSKIKAPNPGSAKEKTMLHAIETGKIQSGEAKLSKFRELLQQELGIDVDISIIKIGGPFDNPPFTPIK